MLPLPLAGSHLIGLVQLLIPLGEAELGLRQVTPTRFPGGEVHNPRHNGVMARRVETPSSKIIEAQQIVQSGQLMSNLK